MRVFLEGLEVTRLEEERSREPVTGAGWYLELQRKWEEGAPEADPAVKPDLSLEESYQEQEDEESHKLQVEGTACANALRNEMQTD